MKGNPYALAAASGLLLALSFPPLHLGFLAFVCFVPLLIVLTARPLSAVFRSSMLAGSVFGACLLYWIANLWVQPSIRPFLVAGVGLLCVYFGFAFVLPFAALRLAVKAFGKPGLLAFPFFFASIEFLRSLSHMGFPWGSVGYTQTEYYQLIQFASVTGLPGITFWVLSVNLCLYFLLAAGLKSRRSSVLVLLLTALFALPLVLWHAVKPGPSARGVVNVAVVQAGVPPSLKRSGEDEERLRILVEETRRLGRGEVELAVWPETAVPGYFRLDPYFQEQVQETCDSLDTPILLGAHDLERLGHKRYFYYNAAFLVSPSRGITGSYHKMHLVPFGERIPFDDIFPRLRRIPLGQGQFSPGREYAIFNIGGKRFATLVCFESIFPRLVRRFVNQGAQFLVNITEDGWYGRTSGQYQHAGMAVMRCIENRISLARCANTGISMFVDPYGRVSGRTKTFVRVTGTASIELGPCGSFYTKHGDICGWGIVTASLIALVLAVLKNRHGSRAGSAVKGC